MTSPLPVRLSMSLRRYLLIVSLMFLPVQLVAQIVAPPALPPAPIVETPTITQITLGPEIEATLRTTSNLGHLYITRHAAEGRVTDATHRIQTRCVEPQTVDQ